MIRSRYVMDDFDFAILYISNLELFYVMPVDVFLSYKSEITLAPNGNRQREPKSGKYKEAWALLHQWAA